MSTFHVECAYCHRWFSHVRRAGRRRIYCRRSCRQRAYECRRQLRVPPRPEELGPQTPTTTERNFRPRHEWIDGQRTFALGPFHAMLSGAPDSRGRLPTVCGTHAQPSSGRAFSALRPESCKTCAHLIIGRTPPSTSRPTYDLLCTQGHLVQVANALALADQLGAGNDPSGLRRLVERALEPVRSQLSSASPSSA